MVCNLTPLETLGHLSVPGTSIKEKKDDSPERREEDARSVTERPRPIEVVDGVEREVHGAVDEVGEGQVQNEQGRSSTSFAKAESGKMRIVITLM